MDNRFLVTSSPHIFGKTSTRKIMLDVIIALLPAMFSGVWFFGPRAAIVCLVTVTACVLAEYTTRKIMKREGTVGDFSAVVTGVLLALNLPPNIEIWKAIVGGVVAIVLVKQLFGGIGQNFMNPALTARVMLLISWGESMTRWNVPKTDEISSATPMALAKMLFQTGSAPAELPGYADMFIGNIAGCIGETSAVAILIGGAYLLIRGIISWEIPAAYISAVAVLTWILGGRGELMTGDPLYHILGGGLLLGAFFMATDYSTSPMTKKGKLIMGLGCGILTSVIRLYTGYPEGVSFAILIMNVIVPLIDRYTVPRAFGGEITDA